MFDDAEAEAVATKAAGIRFAEKDRVSTCALADEIATSVIRQFRSVTEKKNNDAQSVLAGIVVTTYHSQIEVISIATGNRFDQVKSSSSRRNNVRDCHAEVLARRAFKLWLINEWIKIQTKSGESSIFILSHHSKIVLKDGIKLFLYVSSAPCGNACIRKWGQPKKEIFLEDLGSFQLPEDKHVIFHAHAKHEGQTALTYKGATNMLSCSDKILKWNVLGLQGSRLRELCEFPLKLDGIVIGRKFAHIHARRAFCCRLDTKGVHPSLRSNVQHPVLMCSAIKFDEGAVAIINFTRCIRSG
jgi:hypothetical protein